MSEQSIQYTVRKSKRAKRLRLAVYCDGNVVVTTPVGVQKFIIQDFILEKRQWIYEKLRFFRSVDTQTIRTFSEDDYLLSEILFNPYSPQQIENIRAELKTLLDIIENKDTERMQDFLKKVRKNIQTP